MNSPEPIRWWEPLQGAEKVSFMFSGEASFAEAYIESFSNPARSMIKIIFLNKGLPPGSPKKWEAAGFNAARLIVSFTEVEALAMQGVGAGLCCRPVCAVEGGRLSVRVPAHSFELSFQAGFGFLEGIEGIRLLAEDDYFD